MRLAARTDARGVARLRDVESHVAEHEWTWRVEPLLVHADPRHHDVGPFSPPPQGSLEFRVNAHGASRARLARIAKERAEAANLLSDAVNAPYPAACAACGPMPVGEKLRAPLSSDARVLFVSGGLDARTPPSNVDELSAKFSNHAHVIADTAGHESIELLSPEYRELLGGFSSGEKVESRTIALPPARFRTQ